MASTAASFGLPEVKRSLVAAAGGLFRLPRALPPAVAMELILTGDPLPAERAHALGLVNELVAPGEALRAALALAERVSANAPVAVRESRRVAIAAHTADDETLCQRVESQLFRDRHIPKGNLNINCEHGMVILRGELDTPMEIARLEERVRRIPGVRGVQNLLHPHGTPAPNKARSQMVGLSSS